MNQAWRDRLGWFYIIQLQPDGDSHLVKVGWALFVPRRLDEHRWELRAPNAVALRAWRCRRGDEWAAIAATTMEYCEIVLGERYRVDSIESIIARAKAHFGNDGVVPEPLMPKPARKRCVRPTYEVRDGRNVSGLVSASALKAAFGMLPNVAYRLARDRELPHYRIDQPGRLRGRVLFRVSEVRAAIEAMQREEQRGAAPAGD